MEGEDLPVIKDFEEMYNNEKAKTDKLTADLEKVKKELTSEKEINTNLNKTITELQKKNKELETNCNKITIELDTAKLEISNLQTEVLTLSDTIKVVEEERDEAVAINKVNEEKLKKIKEIVG